MSCKLVVLIALLASIGFVLQVRSKTAIAQVKAVNGNLVQTKDQVDLKGLHDWTVIFLDAKTEKPLEGIQVDAQVAVLREQKQVSQLLESNEQGQVRIPLREGQATFLNVRGPGWCNAVGWPIVGELPPEFFKGDPPLPNLEKRITIKLHRGTELRGRLLQPDGNPAAEVSLNAGVYCNQRPWISQAYIDNRMSHTYSVIDWPNWTSRTTTQSDGSFSVTVPPPRVRGWIRLGTIRGGHRPIDTAKMETMNTNHSLVKYAPFEFEVNGSESTKQVGEKNGVIDLGDLHILNGVILQGRVVDATGRPLSNVHLFTSSPRGPLAGRKAISRPDGSFQFMPMNPGTFQLKPDAHLRDENGQKKSREVQAVFVSQEVTLDYADNPAELVIRAEPHVELAFEWIDRRAEKGSVSYYGGFTLVGHLVRADGSKAYWRGKTVKVEREGKEWLIVKVPKSVIGLKIGLHPDQRVTPSYQDERTTIASGNVELGDILQPLRRVIFADEAH